MSINTHIGVLGLQRKINMLLYRNGICTVEQLGIKTPAELLRIDGLGEIFLKQIEDKYREYGERRRKRRKT